MTATAEARVTNCRHLRTKREALAVFARWPSPRVVTAILVPLVALRLAIGTFGWWDLVAVGIVLALSPFTEWVIHRYLLHAKAARIARALDTGSGHQQHHLDPGEIRWLLLRGIDAITYTPMVATLVVGITAPIFWLLGGPIVAPVLTAFVAGQTKLLEYEWAHFLFHTAYRPRTRWYRRLKQNHRLHHWRNEHYWLGVTTNFGDRVLHTLPAGKAEVPLSPTARTLDPDPETEAVA